MYSEESGTWVRTFVPSTGGMLLHGRSELDVGHQIRGKLISTNVELGFIDFVMVE